MKHGLTLPSKLDEDGESVKKTGKKSKQCLYINHFMLEELYVAISEARMLANTDSIDTALRYIKNALDSFHLFQGHRVRAINQQIEMQKIADAMYWKVAETKQNGTEGHLTIDWAMNWESEQKNESQVHNYCKRGRALHVNHLLYYKWDDSLEKPVPCHVTLDQIMGNGNKKDGMANLSFLEATMMKISDEIPHLKWLHLVSDNASNYHKKQFILGIPVLNALSSSVQIESIIHTETQDGKGSCDSHGAVGKWHVWWCFLLSRETMTEYKKVDTPKELAKALAFNGGIQNNGKQILCNGTMYNMWV